MLCDSASSSFLVPFLARGFSQSLARTLANASGACQPQPTQVLLIYVYLLLRFNILTSMPRCVEAEPLASARVNNQEMFLLPSLAARSKNLYLPLSYFFQTKASCWACSALAGRWVLVMKPYSHTS